MMLIWGDGENTKDYLFLADFLDAVQAVVTRGLTGTFNVASGQSISVNRIISIVETLTAQEAPGSRAARFSLGCFDESHLRSEAPRIDWLARAT